MKDIPIKKDGLNDRVNASEFNSVYNEYENVVKTFMPLDANDNKQLLKSIDILSRAITYRDIGTVNHVILSRAVTTGVTEILLDGISFLFSPKFANTASATLQIQGLVSKPMQFLGVPLSNGLLNPDDIYMAVYNIADDAFDIVNITGENSGQGNPTVQYLVADGVLPKDAVNRGQLNVKISISNIVNNTYTASTTNPLSANQARLLNNTINSLYSNTYTGYGYLNTLDKIATKARAERNTLDNLEISDFTNLSSKLASYSATTHNHNTRYYTKMQSDLYVNAKAGKTGDPSQRFSVANAVNADELINKSQLPYTAVQGDGVDFHASYNPNSTFVCRFPYTTWINTTTGEFFICTYYTSTYSAWRGSTGTIIS